MFGSTLRLAFLCVPALGLAVEGLAAIKTSSTQGPLKKPGPVATDLFGDPLPGGAVARLGTIRFRRTTPYIGATYFGPGFAFLADTKTIVSQDGDALQFWEVSTGRLVRKLRVDATLINAFALSPDGRQIAVAAFTRVVGQPGRTDVRVLDAASGRVVQTFSRPIRVDAHDFAFSPDGKLLFSLTAGGVMRLEDIASGKELVQKKIPEGKEQPKGKFKSEDRGVALSLDGRVVAFGSGGKLYSWKWLDEEPREMKAAGVVIRGVFSADGKRLAALSFRDLHVWNTATGELVYERQPPDKQVMFGALAFTPDGKQLLARAHVPIGSSGRGGILILEPTKGGSTEFLDVRRAGSLAVSPDSRLLAVGSGQALRIWDLATLQELAANEQAHSAAPTRICVSSRGFIATAGDDQTVRIWDAVTSKQRQVHQLSGWVRDIAVSPDSQFLAASSLDDTVRLFAIESGREVHRLPGHGRIGGLRTLAFLPDSGSFLSFGDDFNLRHWDVRMGKALRAHAIRPSDLKIAIEDSDPANRDWQLGLGGAAFSADGKTFLLDIAQHLYFFDVASGKQMSRIPHPGGAAMTVSPNGKYLLVDGLELRLWQLASRAFSTIERPRHSSERALAFSPDSRTFASAIDSPSEIRIYETASGQERRRIKGFRGRVRSLAFFPDGRRLASGMSDSTVLIWDLTAPAKE
jgi:WD40 repeat protein